MTPVVSWSPADYFRARDRARAAWQATNQQLDFGVLDSGAVERAGARRSPAAAASVSSASVPCQSPSPQGDALDPPAEETGADTPPTAEATPSALCVPSASAGPMHTTAPVAGLPQDLRDRSQEGA